MRYFKIGLFVVCSVLSLTLINGQRRPSCTTPNGETAQCVSIHSCQILYDAVGTRDKQQLKFLRESRCGYDRDPLVCCGSYDNYHAFQDETSDRRTNSGSFDWDDTNVRPNWGTNTRRTNTNNRRPDSQEFGWGTDVNVQSDWGGNRRTDVGPGSERRTNQGSNNKLPDRSACGLQIGDRILDGQVTGLTEFPWMALLQYRKKTGNLVFSCGGSLISSRYILTAAHCVRGKIINKIGPLVNVRLGEYNTETEQDCSNQLGFEMCNDPPVDSGIEKVTVHPDYNEGSDNRYHDIALIKLKREAPNTDFIKPICLPSRSERANVGERLVVAGWGRTEYSSSSPVKLKLKVPIATGSQCATRFRSAGVTLGNKQLCAGGELGRDSCNGDSGGPLMGTTKNDTAQWYIEGIVSFGAKCGSAGWPGIYTKVSEYVDWIQNNVN